MSHQMAEELSSLAFDLELLVEGWQYLHPQEMGLVEGETEAAVEPREEDAEEGDDVDMTLTE